MLALNLSARQVEHSSTSDGTHVGLFNRQASTYLQYPTNCGPPPQPHCNPQCVSFHCSEFADLTGDGKADYIVQYDGGAAKAYRNLVATGVSTQGPVYYADINGDEKADYLVAFDGSAVNAYINSYDWIPDEGEDDGKDKDDDDNDTNECTPAPKTYSEKQIDRVGEYMDWEKMGQTNSAIVGVQYVTIVNLTPHKFIYDMDSSNSYQMTNWDFADIPQGKARQNAVEYSSTAGSKVDSKGEAYYSIDGTRDKFVVRVTNREFALYPKRIVFDLNDMGAGSREYNCSSIRLRWERAQFQPRAYNSPKGVRRAPAVEVWRGCQP